MRRYRDYLRMCLQVNISHAPGTNIFRISVPVFTVAWPTACCLSDVLNVSPFIEVLAKAVTGNICFIIVV